jgi:hypothetical protein
VKFHDERDILTECEEPAKQALRSRREDFNVLADLALGGGGEWSGSVSRKFRESPLQAA